MKTERTTIVYIEENELLKLLTDNMGNSDDIYKMKLVSARLDREGANLQAHPLMLVLEYEDKSEFTGEICVTCGEKLKKTDFNYYRAGKSYCSTGCRDKNGEVIE